MDCNYKFLKFCQFEEICINSENAKFGIMIDFISIWNSKDGLIMTVLSEIS